MAGHQLAGRGRGKNGWLSSSGCLQFSMVLRHPHPSTTLTLIQYLVAVAMVEAVKGLCAGEVVVPLKLKWPNDLLALSKDAMTGQVSMRKIGGILVTSETSAVADEHQLVIGTFFEHIIANAKLGFGFNVRDTPWSVSLADLVGSVPSKEAVLAAYLATFERLYERMNAVGFPFDLYYSHWLHKYNLLYKSLV